MSEQDPLDFAEAEEIKYKITELSTIDDREQYIKVRVTDEVTQIPDEEVSINFNGQIIFDPKVVYDCKAIKVTGRQSLVIRGLHLRGGLNIRHSNMIKLVDCHLHDPPASMDYLLALTNSTVDVEDSEFYDTKLHGVSADYGAVLTLTNCQIRNTVETNILATGNSIVKCKNCVLDKSGNDLTIADVQSTFIFEEVTLKNSAQTAIFINDSSILRATKCKFMDNFKGALTVRQSFETELIDCEIINSGDTSVLLDDSQTILTNVYMRKCNGNCLNASAHSAAYLKDCHFEESQWPLVAFCDGATGFVSNCVFEKSLMSGVIIRSSSKIVVEDCIIRSCAEAGLRITNSKNITIRNCCIGDSQYGALDVCDLSDAIAEDCILAGGAAHGINVFTGAVLHASRCSLIGPFHSFVWTHHGGSLFASDLCFANSPSPIKQGQWRLFANCGIALMRANIGNPVISEKYVYSEEDMKRDEYKLEKPDKERENDIRIARVDTKYAVEIINSFIVGVGNYELHCNNLAKNEKEAFVLRRCSKCGLEKRCCFFSPCGHAMLCPECWDATPEEERPKICPLCHLPIEKILHTIFHQSYDEKLCGICYSNNADSVIMPCGHSICDDCSKQWFIEHSECPFCREQQVRCRPFVPYE